MDDCLFCAITSGRMGTDFVHEDADMVAFNDIRPKAKTHVLIVPKKHIPTIADLNENEADEVLVGKMVLAARDIAKERELNGYQLRFHVGKSGGQDVFHIHLHLLSDQG
ncbi:MAG: HIT domain-containing protein [Candidatus Peregrinibacteria bacterium]